MCKTPSLSGPEKTCYLFFQLGKNSSGYEPIYSYGNAPTVQQQFRIRCLNQSMRDAPEAKSQKEAFQAKVFKRAIRLTRFPPRARLDFFKALPHCPEAYQIWIENGSIDSSGRVIRALQSEAQIQACVVPVHKCTRNTHKHTDWINFSWQT